MIINNTHDSILVLDVFGESSSELPSSVLLMNIIINIGQFEETTQIII